MSREGKLERVEDEGKGRGSRRYAILLSTFSKEFIIGFLRTSSLPPSPPPFCCLSTTKYKFIRRLNTVITAPPRSSRLLSPYIRTLFRDFSSAPGYILNGGKRFRKRSLGPCCSTIVHVLYRLCLTYVRVPSRKLKYRREARGTQRVINETQGRYFIDVIIGFSPCTHVTRR